MQIVTIYGTRSAAASGKSLYPVEMSVGSLSYARDLLRVAWENPLVSYPILDLWTPSDRLPAARDNSECPALLANLDRPSPSDQIETTRQAHPWCQFCSTTMQGLIRPTQSRHSCKNSSGRFSVSLHKLQISPPAITSFLVP